MAQGRQCGFRGRRGWVPPPLELPLDNSSRPFSPSAAAAAARPPLRNTAIPTEIARDQSDSGANQSTIPGTRRRRRPPRGEEDPHGVLGRERQAAVRSGKSIKRAYTHANLCETHDRQDRSKTWRHHARYGGRGLRCTSGTDPS